ncbi:MAG: redoxin family protein [Coprobacillus sp.]
MEVKNMMKLRKLVVIIIGSLVLVGCGQGATPNKDTTIKDDNMTENKEDSTSSEESTPSFLLKDIKGNMHNLSDYKGKKVYIKMWASWCSICLSGLDEIDKLSNSNKNYEVITIAAPNYKNEKNEGDFTSWFKSLEYKNIQVLLDSDGTFMKEIGVRGYPTSLFIDEKGNLKKIQPGHLNNEQIDEVMNSLK